VSIPKNSKLLRFLPLGTDPKEVKSCFGELPQGNESAHAKGCPYCEHFNGGSSDQCSKATRYRYAKPSEKKKLLPPEMVEWYYGVYYDCATKSWKPFAGTKLTTDYKEVQLMGQIYRIKRILSMVVPKHHEDLLKEAK